MQLLGYEEISKQVSRAHIFAVHISQSPEYVLHATIHIQISNAAGGFCGFRPWSKTRSGDSEPSEV